MAGADKPGSRPDPRPMPLGFLPLPPGVMNPVDAMDVPAGMGLATDESLRTLIPDEVDVDWVDELAHDPKALARKLAEQAKLRAARKGPEAPVSAENTSAASAPLPEVAPAVEAAPEPAPPAVAVAPAPAVPEPPAPEPPAPAPAPEPVAATPEPEAAVAAPEPPAPAPPIASDEPAAAAPVAAASGLAGRVPPPGAAKAAPVAPTPAPVAPSPKPAAAAPAPAAPAQEAAPKASASKKRSSKKKRGSLMERAIPSRPRSAAQALEESRVAERRRAEKAAAKAEAAASEASVSATAEASFAPESAPSSAPAPAAAPTAPVAAAPAPGPRPAPPAPRDPAAVFAAVLPSMTASEFRVVSDFKVFRALWTAHRARAVATGDLALCVSAQVLLGACDRLAACRVAAAVVESGGESWAIWLDLERGELLTATAPAAIYLAGV